MLAVGGIQALYTQTAHIDMMNRAQYTNMVGVLGKDGKHGRTTLYVNDVETFYLKEDIPKGYRRRESPVGDSEY